MIQVQPLIHGVLLCLSFSATAWCQMQYPLSVTVTDSAAYVADRDLPGIWKLDSGTTAEFFKGSKQFRTPLNAVRCITVDNEGRLLVGDSATREIYRFDAQGEPTPLTHGGIGTPMSLAVDSTGQIYAADLELHRIYRIPKAGGKPEVLAEVRAPRGICVDDQDRLLVVNHGDNQVVRIDSEGTLQVVVKGRPFQFPHNIAVGAEGSLYVTDGYAKAVWKIDSAGKATKWVSGDPLQNPVGLVAQGSNLLVADPHAKAIFQIDADGKVSKLQGE